jgi:hypothetical protein
MKLFDIEINKLIELLDRAKGNVFLVTDEGDNLNLKSKLCQLYGVRTLLEKSKDATVSPEIKFENTDDEAMFIRFLIG